MENTQGVVVPHLDLTAADKLLTFDLQVGVHEEDLGS